MASPLKVLIQSPNATILAGLDATASQSKDVAVTSVAGTAGRERWRVHQRLDVVVIHMVGMDWSTYICAHEKPALVLAVDDGVSGADVLHALRRGVRGIVSITEDLTRLLQACRETAVGSVYLSPYLVTLLADHMAGRFTQPMFGLTAREHQVLRHLTIGKSSAGIAEALRIDRRTVRQYLANIYRKLEVRGQTEAVARAYREGMVA